MRAGHFSLKRFFRELEIPKTEQGDVQDCFVRGVERYYHHIYGYDKYGEGPAWLISERMHEPYIFGFAAVEVVRHPTLPLETRFKIIQYLLEHMQPLAEYGTPHGLPAIVSFLAAVGALDLPRFRLLLQIAEVEGRLYDDWLFEEVRILFDWLIAKADLPDDERRWWLWHLSVRCEQPQIGKPLLEFLLNHPALPPDLKRGLGWAWLDGKAPGPPPEQWQAFEAMIQGDPAGLKTLAAEMEAPLPMEADDSEPEGEPFTPSFGLLRTLLVSEMGGYVLIPHYFKRRALLALAQLGEDLLTLAQTYLGASRNFDADAVNQGVADLLREYRASLPEDAVRELVEKGLRITSVATRKTFYQLGADLFGPDYWQHAEQDNAASIRKWATTKRNPESKPKCGRKRVKDRHPHTFSQHPDRMTNNTT